MVLRTKCCYTETFFSKQNRRNWVSPWRHFFVHIPYCSTSSYLQMNSLADFLFLFLISQVKENSVTYHFLSSVNIWRKYLWKYSVKSTYAEMHDPHTTCLKCFPWCYYTISWQAIPMARYHQYLWLCKISSKYSLEFTLCSELEFGCELSWNWVLLKVNTCDFF